MKTRNKRALLFILFLSINTLLFAVEEKDYVHYKEYNYSKDYILEKNFDTIYLVAASPTSDNLGSLGAHAFIVLAHGDDFSDSFSINYYAYHERLSNFAKSIKGATKGLTGYVDIREFHEITERYTIGQNRSLFVYKTNIDKSYIPIFLDKVYENKNKDLRYQFFTYTCSSFLGDIFSTILDTDDKDYYFPNLIMPARLIYLFKEQGLIVDSKTISPPLVKILYNNINMDKEDIIDRYDYFNTHNRETTVDDGFVKFSVSFDNFESNTIFSENVSKLYLGMDNYNFSFGFSLFDNQLYEQRQSAIELYDFKLFDTLFNFNNGLKLKKLTLLEKSKYPKINYSTYKPSKYLIIKYNENNSSIDIKGGLGLSFGTLNSVFSVIPTVETNISDLMLTLRIKSLFCFYLPNMYFLVNFDYPIYNETINSSKQLEVNLGYNFNDKYSLSGAYDILKNQFNVYFVYKFYPLIK